MGLLKQRLQFVTKMMDINFEKQNYKFARVLKFISRLEDLTQRRC